MNFVKIKCIMKFKLTVLLLCVGGSVAGRGVPTLNLLIRGINDVIPLSRSLLSKL